MMNKEKVCRLCKEPLAQSSILSLSPMPKAAQYYPKEEEFSTDKGIDLNIYRCRSCDLLQLSHDTPLVDYYKEVITAASFSNAARMARLEEFRNFVQEFHLEGKKAIEVGCGKGGMVSILNELSLECIGLEYNHDFVQFGRENGNNIIQGYITELNATHNGKYDLFISLNYIEHQPDTKAFIQALHKITTDDAVGYITAPNVSYLLQTETLYEFVADHLVYFTQESMQRAFEMNGFEVLHSEIINNENDIALTLRKRKVEAIKGKERVAMLIQELQNFIQSEKEAGREVAIWGAGHRTLALLSLAKLDNIAAVVDSAPFKQGKYTPITHLKIISAQELENSHIETVIVMLPGIYPDEVIKQLHTFKRKLRIYKLLDNSLVAS